MFHTLMLSLSPGDVGLLYVIIQYIKTISEIALFTL